MEHAKCQIRSIPGHCASRRKHHALKTHSLLKVEFAPLLSPIRKKKMGLEWPSKMDHFSSLQNVGRIQLSCGSQELPKHLFIFNLFESAHKRSVDNRGRATTNRGIANTSVPSPLLPGTHCTIEILPNPDFRTTTTIANNLHRCDRCESG